MTSATKFPNNVAPPAPTGVYSSDPAMMAPGTRPADAPLPLVGGYASLSPSIPTTQGRNMANLIVPPGGFAGFAQQTAATQAMFQRAGRVGGLRSAAKRRRRKKTAAKTTRRRRKTATRRRGKARLVKGSAAAKRYMARIRKMRKRR